MQGTLFLCHAPADQDFALDLAAFLERGTGLALELVEAQIRRGEDLISKVRAGHSADAVLVILSPDAVPSRWVREEWTAAFWDEPAAIQVDLATVLHRNCKFPDLLRRRNFFDLTETPLDGFRAIKQWLLGLHPAPAGRRLALARPSPFLGREAELETLRRELGDAPGRVILSGPAAAGKTTLALEFGRRFHRDFEEAFWLNCAGRTAAALAGELASQLGLRLPGDVADNVLALQRFLSSRRCLVVFDDVEGEAAHALVPGGKSSALLTTRRDYPGSLRLQAVTEQPLDEAPSALDDHARRLLAAMSACPPGAARLPLAAQAAGLDEPAALDALTALRAAALVRPLEEDHYEVHPLLRERIRPDARRYAQAVSRASGGALPEIQHAFAWTVSGNDDEDWELARHLARMGFTLACAQDRLAEACEFMETLARLAEQRADREVLADCAWERSWILEKWGRLEEAQALHRLRRLDYEDQMSLDFG